MKKGKESKLQKGNERLTKHNLEMQHTSLKASHTDEEISCTSYIASSHKHTKSSQKCKSNIPPALMYAQQYKYKVKKGFTQKKEESCAVLGSLIRDKLKDPVCKKCLEYELPELMPAEERDIGKEIAMASKYGAKGKFEKVEEISGHLKSKFSSLRKASKQCPDLVWKILHKIFNPKITHEKRRVSKSNTEDVHNVMKSASCLVQLPSKKHSKVYFLT